ncbi:chitin elicitor receptor kinase 1 [Medicago truncatula]|uniref:chitin elicitor receptor kinase 1 n=1 Tax=Medicago truncatula TaxID=3880 RepID=UPI0019687531|nr:chitin elicitor receptor kinase 1 [Medicago truncatula]
MDAELLQRYNPGVNFSQGSGLVFIPGKDKNGVYVPLPHEKAGLAFKHIRESAILIPICFWHVSLSLNFYLYKQVI